MAVRNPIPVGQKFNRLTVLAEAPKTTTNPNRRVLASCECGNVGSYCLSEVRTGKTKSCGCLSRSGELQRKHGHIIARKASPEYQSWASMRTRCVNRNSAYWALYGGRGISICNEWEDFRAFLRDMGPRPEGTSLDRIDPDGNYTPENCRWATRKEQMNNRRCNTFLEYNGERATIAEWADRFGLAYNTLIARVNRLKWPIDKALNTPPRKWH